MEARGSKTRAIGRKRLSARYWRLRFADDVATRLAEYIHEQSEYDYDDRDDYDPHWYREHDPLGASLDVLIPELRARIRAVGPFNPLPLSGASPACDPAWLPASPEPIEQRLVDHLERLST